MTYIPDPPANWQLTTGNVILRDVAEGRFANVRYADFSGYCLPEGYVMTFLLTISGTYKVWVYTDTEKYRLVAGSPKVGPKGVPHACLPCCHALQASR